jgi:cytochrome P450
MVTGYEEACAVYTDADTFSSCNSVTGPFPGFPVPLEGDDVSELIEQHRDELPFSDQLTTMDPPKHHDHRHLLMRQLTPKRLKENEEFVWRLADRQIDEFIERGECEFNADFANPYTMFVIADLLGVPEDEHEEFRDACHADHATATQSAAPRTQCRTAHSSGCTTDSVPTSRTVGVEPRRRRAHCARHHHLPDGTLPEVIDVVRVAANVFSAGQETTVRLLGSALVLLGERPELQQLLRDRRDLIANFVEETLRIEAPVKGDFRLSRRATTVDGVDIAAGSTVMVLNGAANRDPRRFDDPTEFRVDRANAREHLAFGRGPHSCPGGPLARMESRVAIERLLDRTVRDPHLGVPPRAGWRSHLPLHADLHPAWPDPPP